MLYTVPFTSAGPAADDSYADSRADYTKNEVAVDYNAGFTGVLAALVQSSNTWVGCVTAGFARNINLY